MREIIILAVISVLCIVIAMYVIGATIFIGAMCTFYGILLMISVIFCKDDFEHIKLSRRKAVLFSIALLIVGIIFCILHIVCK